jgi:HD-like signal output (HDOD) protein
MSKQYDIDELLDDIITLPSLPTTVVRVTAMIGDPDCSLTEVGKLISTDPGLAMKALRLVNSARYGLPERVVSVEHATSMLGAKVIQNLILTAAVFDTFTEGANVLLRHSVGTALAMQTLVRTLGNDSPIAPDDGFVYGLLHDVGKILLEEYMPSECGLIHETAAARQETLGVVEAEYLGVDHAELGSRLSLKWKLADTLTQAINGHHDLSRCTDDTARRAAATLSVADYIAHASGLPSHIGAVTTIDEAMWAEAGFSNADLAGVLDTFFGLLPVIDEMMELAAA